MSFLSNLFGDNEQEIVAKAKIGERDSGILIFNLAYAFSDTLMDLEGKSSTYKKAARLEAIMFLSYFGRTKVQREYSEYVLKNFKSVLKNYIKLSSLDKHIKGDIDAFIEHRLKFYVEELVTYLHIKKDILPVKSLNFLYDNPLDSKIEATKNIKCMMEFPINIRSIVKGVDSLDKNEYQRVIESEARRYGVKPVEVRDYDE